MSDFLHATRLTIRSLVRSPGFTAVALITLALGIGANTTIFSVVNAVLVEALPFPEPDRLVQLNQIETTSGGIGSLSPGNFRDWAEAPSLESAAAFTGETANLTGYGPPRQLTGTETMGDLFGVLGVRPLIGRTIAPADDLAGAERVVVLSFQTWRELFADGDPVGSTVTLDGEPHTVIGVMPDGFRFPDAATSFWLPARYPEGLRASRTEVFLSAVARLAPGASVEAARAELGTIAARLRAEHPVANEGTGALVRPLKAAMTEDVSTLLRVLMGAVGVVLLIACVNLANLMLARASTREREIAVRKALGASRSRLATQVLLEGLVIATAGGALGVWLAGVGLDVVLALFPLDLPRVEDVSLDRGVLAFTALITAAAGILFALLPALRVARQAPALRLRDRGSAQGWTRRSLVVAEVVLAVMLLSGAGLLVRSFLELRAVDPGYEPAGLATMRVSLPGAVDLERRVAFFRELDERLEALPGVAGASYMTTLPAIDGGPLAWLNLYDRPAPEGEPPLVAYRALAPDFPDVAGLPLLRGRLPDPETSRERSPEVVIDEVIASRFWPEGDPLGEQLSLGPDDGWIPASTIVGVVGAAEIGRLGGGTSGIVYLPHALVPWWGSMAVVARASGDPARLLPAMRDQVAALDPMLPVTEAGLVGEMVLSSISAERSTAILLGMLAGLALVLAAVGLFGVLSYTVSRRIRELGIRAALGADAARMRWLVVRQGLAMAALGLVPGVVAAMLLASVLDRMLFGVGRTDPLTYLGTALLLLATAALASWAPARRATRVDPAEALRAD